MSKDPKEQLGVQIVFPSESLVSFNPPGYKVAYYGKTVNVSVGIGKDHTADLIMSEEAWEVLKGGAEVNINLMYKSFSRLQEAITSKQEFNIVKPKDFMYGDYKVDFAPNPFFDEKK